VSILGGAINNTEVTKTSFFVPYTPIVTGIGGAVTTNINRGRFIQLGKLVYVEIGFSLLTVAGGTTGVTTTVPFNVDTQDIFGNVQNFFPILSGTVNAGAPPGVACFGVVIYPDTLQVVKYDNIPVAVAGYQFFLSGWYSKK